MTSCIAGRRVGPGHAPFVIAEMSGNHNQSLDRALEIVDAAARCGAHALKMQTYTADTITLDIDGGEFLIDDPDSLWAGRHRSTSCTRRPTRRGNGTRRSSSAPGSSGMIAFSTPFDETAVDFLESSTCPATRSRPSRTPTCRSSARSPPPASR